MRFWIALFVSFSLFTVNILPQTSFAKTHKEQKSKKSKSKKTKSSKSKASKKSGKKTASKSKSKKSASRAKNKSRQVSRAAIEPYSPRYSEFLVDSETGKILHQEAATERRYPASLTKMMTVYLTFEQLRAGNLRMNQRLRVSAYAASMPKTNLSLSPGDDITVKEAILAIIVHSANDAAVVLAENIAGDEDRFAQIMTQRAHQLGMKSTYFQNASGLHDPNQVTSAKDMALLAIALQKHYSQYYDMFSRTAFDFNGRTYEGHNRVTRSYSGATGLKTGFVRASGFNLVTSATRYEGSLVGVVMGGRTAATRDERMKEILDAGFDRLASLKKKGSYAFNDEDEGSLDFSSIEPASGNKVAVAPEAEEPENIKVASFHVNPSVSAEKVGIKKLESVKTKVTQAAKVAAAKDVTVKHFANNFMPEPKAKPKKRS